MSSIEEAIKKLRKRQGAGTAAVPTRSGGRFAVPVAGRKKVEIHGPKHHISQERLIESGCLVPLEHAHLVADEFRRIKRPLIANAIEEVPGVGDNPNVIMIASAMPGAGKTFCSINLAVSISLERELNVLLVDADVAKPHISREFGLADEAGLIDMLLDDTISFADTLVRTDLNDIQVLPAGHSHPQATELLASDRMSSIVSELSHRYRDRIIVLDSPPLMGTSEAQALASQVGQIALVVEAGQTSSEALRQTIEILALDKPVNVILNKSAKQGSYTYYGGAYAYGYEAD
jgi:exopolysaccharide/PEP-CTERM locus tyrosine autokinase